MGKHTCRPLSFLADFCLMLHHSNLRFVLYLDKNFPGMMVARG